MGIEPIYFSNRSLTVFIEDMISVFSSSLTDCVGLKNCLIFSLPLLFLDDDFDAENLASRTRCISSGIAGPTMTDPLCFFVLYRTLLQARAVMACLGPAPSDCPVTYSAFPHHPPPSIFHWALPRKWKSAGGRWGSDTRALPRH